MSLARAFTKRGRRPDMTASHPRLPARSLTIKASQVIDRTTISSPIELISTTNMLSYNAPDLPKRHASLSSSSSHSSAEDSDQSSTSNLSRETLTDASSVDSSPSSPKPNHLSGYFPATKVARRSASSGNLHQKTLSSESECVPAIPHRALSHSKRAHEQLARKRSLQHMPSSARYSRAHRLSREQRSSIDMFRSNVEPDHPFGRELEQLNEVAEEFGGAIRDAAVEEDLVLMKEKGLLRLCAADYINEIEPLFSSMFNAPLLTVNAAWI